MLEDGGEVLRIDGLELRDADWAAEALGVEKNTLYRYLGEGTLPGFKLGKKWFVDVDDLGSFIRRERVRQTNVRRIENWVDQQLTRQAIVRRGPDGQADAVALLQQIADRPKFTEWIVTDLIASFRLEGIEVAAVDFDLESALKGTAAWVGRCVHCSLAPVLYSNQEEKSETAGLCRECEDKYLSIVYEDSDAERDPFVRRGIT